METKDVKWVLRNAVIWDFFYEYCSYFSRRSLAAAFRRAGFREVVSKHIFGGQYLWAEASARGENTTEPAPDMLEDLLKSYTLRENEMRNRWTDCLVSLRGEGPVALWGAGAKGVTFASLFDANAEMLSCVVDMNPAKQGRFIAGSAHPIVAPSALKKLGIRNVVLLNTNYLEEVRESLAAENAAIDIITDPRSLERVSSRRPL